MPKHFDVIIVGAGMSGLACARKLIGQGARVLILEARSRIGGRVLTKHEPHLKFPLEMGAEFIHGAPKVIISELEASGKPFYDVRDGHLYTSRKGKSNSVEIWERLDSLQKKLALKRKRDRSVQDFIDAQSSVDLISRSMFLGFMEGFQAADPKLLSEKVMALAQKQGEGDIDEVSMFRIAGGYDGLLKIFLGYVQKDTNAIQLNTMVKAIRWSKHQVSVECQNPSTPKASYTAKKIVVTLPMGVLKSNPASRGYVHFDPVPKGFEKMLRGFEMGFVERILFLFRSRFWEDHFGQPVSFIHGGYESLFATWWSQSPLRVPLLVAWQGGPKAFDLAQIPTEQKIQIALESLSQSLKLPMHLLKSQLVRWYAHDWTNDPFARGAYSYTAVGGLSAWKKFQVAFADTLYFAGEAFARHVDRGTVHGAINTGYRVADSILSKK